MTDDNDEPRVLLFPAGDAATAYAIRWVAIAAALVAAVLVIVACA